VDTLEVGGGRLGWRASELALWLTLCVLGGGGRGGPRCVGRSVRGM
jgi:hypothetical protein